GLTTPLGRVFPCFLRSRKPKRLVRGAFGVQLGAPCPVETANKDAVPDGDGATDSLSEAAQGRARATVAPASMPSRWARLRASLRARLMASAFWRAFFSDGFS